jgi:hypothetical protein
MKVFYVHRSACTLQIHYTISSPKCHSSASSQASSTLQAMNAKKRAAGMTQIGNLSLISTSHPSFMVCTHPDEVFVDESARAASFLAFADFYRGANIVSEYQGGKRADCPTSPLNSPKSILGSIARASSEWPTSSNASVASLPISRYQRHGLLVPEYNAPR